MTVWKLYTFKAENNELKQTLKTIDWKSNAPARPATKHYIEYDDTLTKDYLYL